jgi:two-component system, sensor histidine kinase LadS
LARKLYELRGSKLKMILLSSVGNALSSSEAKNIGIETVLTKLVKASQLYSEVSKLFAPAAPVNVLRANPEQAPKTPARPNPLRILVAEDNAVNIKFVMLLLSRFGYRADVAGNGKEAVEAVSRQAYDVVLMDVQMPEMDGIEATKLICQRIPPRSRPRIIAVTAGVMQSERQACLDAGMDEFLNKPILAQELEEALARCVRLEAELPNDFALRHPLDILVVEDDDNSRRMVVTMLERLGYAPIAVNHGDEALDKVRAQLFDVIFMDIHMPQMNGLEVTARIHNQTIVGQRPRIIATTASVLVEDRQACIDAGMDAFLNKPLLPREVMDALTASRRLPRPAMSSEAEFDESTLDEMRASFREEDVLEIVELFLKDLPVQLAHTHQAWATQNWGELRRIVHGLRSASKSIGAAALSEVCGQVEGASSSSNIDATRIRTLLPELDRRANRAGDQLRSLLKKTSEAKMQAN